MADLRLQNVTKQYSGHTAVDAINLQIDPGEFVALLGPSGCGKTTTLRMIAGFVQPTHGSILVGGTDVTRMLPEQRNMGMVFQSYALFPHMTVRKNIEFGLQCRRISGPEANERIDRTLDMVGLKGLEERYPRQLSGGQQQRVALARIMVLHPSLLLFDEPLSNLDAALRGQMRREIKDLQRRLQVTSVFVTHDQEEAMGMADRIVVLSKGKVEQIGTPAEIYDNPKTRFVAGFIGSTNFFEGRCEVSGAEAAFRTGSGLMIPLAQPSDVAGTVFTIRPERIDLSRGHSGDIVGHVSSVMNLGANAEYIVRLKSGEELKVHRQRRSDEHVYNEGDDVSVIWKREDGRIITE